MNNKKSNADSEDLFLAELIRAKAFWTIRAKELKDKDHNNEKELAYAEFFKLGIHQFTLIEELHHGKKP